MTLVMVIGWEGSTTRLARTVNEDHEYHGLVNWAGKGETTGSPERSRIPLIETH